jgi:hypothetical protein
VTAVRRPAVLGLARRAGTSTLAAALHAADGGVLAVGTPGAADVLVCPADAAALRQASTLATAPGAGQPVLVLTGAVDPASAAELGRRFGAVVALPHVHRWPGIDARAEAAAVLAVAPDRLPPDVRAYAHALLRVVSVLVGSGRLQDVPPAISRPAGTVLWRGLRPAVGPVPRAGHRRPAEPDDEALESDAEPLLAGRTG